MPIIASTITFQIDGAQLILRKSSAMLHGLVLMLMQLGFGSIPEAVEVYCVKSEVKFFRLDQNLDKDNDNI